MTFKPRPKPKKRRKRSLKGPMTKGDVIARCLASTADHHTLRRLVAMLTDNTQKHLVLAGLFEHMDVIEKLAFLAEGEVPEDWRRKHLPELQDDEDADAGA